MHEAPKLLVPIPAATENVTAATIGNLFVWHTPADEAPVPRAGRGATPDLSGLLDFVTPNRPMGDRNRADVMDPRRPERARRGGPPIGRDKQQLLRHPALRRADPRATVGTRVRPCPVAKAADIGGAEWLRLLSVSEAFSGSETSRT